MVFLKIGLDIINIKVKVGLRKKKQKANIKKFFGVNKKLFRNFYNNKKK